MCAHMADVGLATTLDGVQSWYHRHNPQNTKPHACVLFADREFLESHEHTFHWHRGVKLFKLVPSNETKEKLDIEDVVEWRNDINENANNAPPPGGSDAQCSSASSSSDFVLFITLVHYGGDEAAKKHALFGHKENQNNLSRKFTSLHIFAQDTWQQEHVYERLSNVANWHTLFTGFLECGLPEGGPRPMIRQQARSRVARPMDPEFHKRREEFKSKRAQDLQLGQRADDLFMVINMALARGCIGQQVWEKYRRWYHEVGRTTTDVEPFHHADTFETFLSERNASPLLSSSWEKPYRDRMLNVGDAVAKMREAETVNHWLAHLYRLEVEFLTERMGLFVVNHRGVCDAVLRRVAGGGGAAQTSHALFSLAIGERIPLTAELVAKACSGIHLFRKVLYEIDGKTERLFTSPDNYLHEAMPMEVEGNGGAES